MAGTKMPPAALEWLYGRQMQVLGLDSGVLVGLCKTKRVSPHKLDVLLKDSQLGSNDEE